MDSPSSPAERVFGQHPDNQLSFVSISYAQMGSLPCLCWYTHRYLLRPDTVDILLIGWVSSNEDERKNQQDRNQTLDHDGQDTNKTSRPEHHMSGTNAEEAPETETGTNDFQIMLNNTNITPW